MGTCAASILQGVAPTGVHEEPPHSVAPSPEIRKHCFTTTRVFLLDLANVRFCMERHPSVGLDRMYAGCL